MDETRGGAPEGASGREACDPGLGICGCYEGRGVSGSVRGQGSRLACWRPLQAHTPCKAACERWRHSDRTCTHTPPAGQKAQPWAASLKTSASSVENRLLTSPGGLSAESLVSEEGEGGGRCTDSQAVGRSAEPGAG